MELNENPGELRVGDLVVTEFREDEAKIVRTITSIRHDKKYGSGYAASASSGKPCPNCGRCGSEPIQDVDAAWFLKVELPKGGEK